MSAAAVAEDRLLDPAADLVNDAGTEPDQVEGVQDRAGVFELVVDGVPVPMERAQSGDARAEVLAAALEPVAVGPLRPARDQVSGRRDLLRPRVPEVRSTIPVSPFGPQPSCSDSLVDTWCQTRSSIPRWVTPSKLAGSSPTAYSG